eukprot:12626217-Heterocapsa_arctica.AAC.1
MALKRPPSLGWYSAWSFRHAISPLCFSAVLMTVSPFPLQLLISKNHKAFAFKRDSSSSLIKAIS